MKVYLLLSRVKLYPSILINFSNNYIFVLLIYQRAYIIKQT